VDVGAVVCILRLRAAVPASALDNSTKASFSSGGEI
jgi:hypothetical protein